MLRILVSRTMQKFLLRRSLTFALLHLTTQCWVSSKSFYFWRFNAIQCLPATLMTSSAHLVTCLSIFLFLVRNLSLYLFVIPRFKIAFSFCVWKWEWKFAQENAGINGMFIQDVKAKQSQDATIAETDVGYVFNNLLVRQWDVTLPKDGEWNEVNRTK